MLVHMRTSRKWIIAVTIFIWLWIFLIRRSYLKYEEYIRNENKVHQKTNHAYKIDGIALTPPMGWNSWNYFRCKDLNEKLIEDVVTALVSSDLRNAGYVYVNLDDCWQIGRDNRTGRILADVSKFPRGIKYISKLIHSNGLKFGIYTDIGYTTCEKRPGSLGFETIDVETYAEWGVDLVKNDDCDTREHNKTQLYGMFWNAMKRVKRPMVHSVKGDKVDARQAVGFSHMRRVGWDIYDNWGAVLAMVNDIIDGRLWRFARPGFWNDADMLEIGNGGLTPNENIAHMILWCALKSPLLMGNDLRALEPFIQELLAHDELIAVNQDPLGLSAELVESISPPNGNAERRVVTKDCDTLERAQRWTYRRDSGLLKNPATGKCIGATSDVDMNVIVKACDTEDNLQLWDLDGSSAEIRLRNRKEMCLSIGTNYYIQAKVLDCRERQQHKWYKGPNRPWYPWNDGFSIKTVSGGPEEEFLISNRAMTWVEHCLHIGDRQEIDIFSGQLSFDRYVSVVLNRDDIPHKVILKRSHLVGTVRTGLLHIRDVYQRKDVGYLDDVYEVNVSGRSAIMLTFR